MASIPQGGARTMASVPVQLKRSEISKEEQRKTPYLDALLAYVREETVPFHVPGHKQGRGIHPKLKDNLGSLYLAMDLTEVLGLDNLSHPTGVLKEAQELAAKAYGVDYSFFLVNGSSSGLHSMLMAVCNPGDSVILPRNVHKSAFSSLIFSGVVPIYMMPEFDEKLQVDHTVTEKTLEKALNDNPNAKAVLLVSPTYYGVSADVKRFVDMIHAHGKIAIVDEAWGPHLHFHPKLPFAATDAGADLVVNSTHKLLSSLTQSSILHLSGNRVDRSRLEAVLQLFLTTSPSCLLLASIDATRMQMATEGERWLDKAIMLSEDARARINKIPGLSCIGREIIGRPGVFALDPTRLVVSSTELGYTGYEVENILRKKYHVQVELSDLFHVVALVTLGDDQEQIDRLVDGLSRLEANDSGEPPKPRITKNVKLPDWPPFRLTPREAFVAPHETIPFERAVGRISTELITTYPPGIPSLVPGEELTRDVLDYLVIERDAGSRITGAADSTLSTLRVVK